MSSSLATSDNSFPFQAGDDVTLVADPNYRSTVVEVLGRLAELRNGIRYSATELRLATDPTEQWIDLPGYDGRYRLSSHGKLLAIDYNRQGRQRLFKLGKLSPGLGAAYTLPDLNTEELAKGTSKPTRRMAGQLVAENFIGPALGPSWHIGHRDGNRANLRADNLFWFENCRIGARREDTINEYLGLKTVLTAAQAALVAV